MPIAWVHPYGQGREFYCSLGHNEFVYYNPQILKYYLAGIQYALGDLDDKEIVAGCRERFQKFLADPNRLAPDLRPSVLAVVGRYADETRPGSLTARSNSSVNGTGFVDGVFITQPRFRSPTLPDGGKDRRPSGHLPG